jgi:PTH1 family peptidyl-tRNA hydrolase
MIELHRMSTYLFVGLGNPGEDYERTRHNIGRMALASLADELGAPDFDVEKGAQSLLTRAKAGKHDVWMALPETFMNKSGFAVAYLARVKKIKPENIVVIHDDMDLPAGVAKMSFARGDGGHNGVKSVIRQLKTNEFVRVRIGVSPATASGKTRKPSGEDKIIRFLTGVAIKDSDMKTFKKVFKRVNASLETLLTKDRGEAMKVCNTQ